MRLKEIGKQVAYASSLEYLLDELKRLDLLIRLRVLEQRSGQPIAAMDQFKGLVLWDEEINGLLTRETSSSTNEAYLSDYDAEFQPLAARLRELESEIQERRAASLAQGVFLSLPHICELFNLNSFEEQCVLMCLAPEVDRKYEKLFAYLQDDVTRRKPTVDLVLSLLCRSTEEKVEARVAFEIGAPLLDHRLVRVIEDPIDAPSPLLARALKLDDRIVSYLLGSDVIDPRLEHFARRLAPESKPCPVGIDQEVYHRLRELLQLHFAGAGSAKRNAVLYFYGPYGSGKREMAEALAGGFALPVILADAEKMLDDATAFEEVVQMLGRETRLQPTALVIENFAQLLSDDQKPKPQASLLLETIGSLSQLTCLLGNQMWEPQGLSDDLLFIAREFPIPDDRARQAIWADSLAAYSHRAAADLDDLSELAAKFRFTPGKIRDAIVSAHNIAVWRRPDAPQITLSDLYAACRAQSITRLGKLARKVEPHYRWPEIVLPADQMAQLRELCDQVKTRRVVYGDWGFNKKLSLGKGLNVLFSGPPGTGKTMAAEVIANELNLDLYRIDLSQVVSKYIGETEKNLSQIFTEAQSSNAILFFDEADALFGRRSEVKDSHDRYANIEIGYLLQEMEEYDGIAILATNLRQNMDEAFVRRLQIIVEFPFPDEEHRRRIWQVTFPPEAPVGSDVDFNFLAREIKLAGGNIKNIVLAAAFYAASSGGPIRMNHLEEATRREYQKIGWPWSEGEWNRQSMRVS